MPSFSWFRRQKPDEPRPKVAMPPASTPPLAITATPHTAPAALQRVPLVLPVASPLIMSALRTGNNHYEDRKNCQDRLLQHTGEHCLVLGVADGCGSAPASELGALFGLMFLATIVDRHAVNGVTNIDWTAVTQAYRTKLRELLNDMPKNALRVFSHTTMLCAIDKRTGYLVVASCGDGFLARDGQAQWDPTFPHNMPPFLNYALMPKSQTEQFFRPEDLTLAVRHATHLNKLGTLVLATDGVHHVSDEVRAEFWRKVTAAKTKKALVAVLDEYGDYLSDDTALVVVRRA